MQFQTKYTPEVLAHWRSILGKHDSVESALAELGVPARSLHAAFGRLDPPERAGQWLRTPAYSRAPGQRSKPARPPQDPLAAHRERKDASATKAELKAVLERLHEAEERFRFAERLSGQQPVPPRITPRETSSGLREGCAVALLSDCHIEETVDPRTVAGRNEYNLAIARLRMERFFDGVEWLVGFNREAWAIRDLVLWLGGDLMTGYIHEELVETNELAPVEAVLELRGWLRRGIAQLLKDRELARIVVPCNFGNHGRTTTKKRIKTGAKNSFEWMLYQVLATDFAEEPRVVFEIAAGEHCYVEAFGRTLHFTHGDSVRYWGGVGGISIPINKRVPRWDNVKRADLHHLGHFHQLTDLGHTMINGSLIGYTDFAFSIGADYEPPQQGFYVLDAKRGKANVTPIWVDESSATEVAEAAE